MTHKLLDFCNTQVPIYCRLLMDLACKTYDPGQDMVENKHWQPVFGVMSCWPLSQSCSDYDVQVVNQKIHLMFVKPHKLKSLCQTSTWHWMVAHIQHIMTHTCVWQGKEEYCFKHCCIGFKTNHVLYLSECKFKFQGKWHEWYETVLHDMLQIPEESTC